MSMETEITESTLQQLADKYAIRVPGLFMMLREDPAFMCDVERFRAVMHHLQQASIHRWNALVMTVEYMIQTGSSVAYYEDGIIQNGPLPQDVLDEHFRANTSEKVAWDAFRARPMVCCTCGRRGCPPCERCGRVYVCPNDAPKGHPGWCTNPPSNLL
jgi:hypothetical protein